MPEDDIESLLRRTLSERAGQAPNSGMLEQRTLAAVRRAPARRKRPTWLVPVSVAASVLVIVGATAGGVALVNDLNTGKHSSVAATGTTALATTPSAPTTAPSPTATSTPTPTSTSDGNPKTESTQTKVAPVSPPGGPVPPGFEVSDLTFVSVDDGWALGTAPCKKNPCTSIVRTTDGGKSWVGIPAPLAELEGADNCTKTCVEQVRFATPLIGYVFGLDALYMTTNGGASWVKQTGSATALEISYGNVLRVSTTCTPGCPYVVQMSDIGSTSWHTVFKPTGTDTGAGLVREGPTAFIQIYGNPAGGAGTAHTNLYRSTDNGAKWTALGEPCPQNAGSTEVDSTAMAAGQKGTLAVLCRPRVGDPKSFVATFAKNAAKPVAGSPTSGLDQPIGALSDSVVFAQRPLAKGQGVLLRSVDGGQHWTAVQADKASPSSTLPGFLGFENPTTGRWVSPADPTTVWTTTDAGATWTSHTFS